MKSSALRGSITFNLVVGVIMMLVTVIGVLVLITREQNRDAEEALRRMVRGGVEALGHRVQDATVEVANTYALASRRAALSSRAFAEAQMRRLAAIDLLAVVPSDEPPVAFHRGSDHVRVWRGIGDELAGAIPLARIESQAIRLGFSTLEGETFLLAATAVFSHGAMSEPFRLVAGIQLDEGTLDDLAQAYLIDELELHGKAGHGGIPLLGFDGEPVGELVWKAVRPGDELLRRNVLSLAAVVIAFVAVAAWRVHQLTRRLSEREEQAHTMAQTDALTSLPNRHAFSQLLRLDETAEAARRGELAVIHLDLKDFKRVNDIVGSEGGDTVIRELARRLRTNLPKHVELVRYAGDEFMLHLTGRDPMKIVQEVCRRVREILLQPVKAGGFPFVMVPSIGYAYADEHLQDAAEVSRRASVAQFRAKLAATADPVAYDPSMETGAVEKKRMETALREAMARKDISLMYQPVTSARNFGIQFSEALARWTDPMRGTVSPATFIAVAEETGLIHDLTLYILDRVCKDLADRPHMKVSVNISALQLRDTSFPSKAAAIADRYRIDPSRIDLEVTENVLIDNPTTARTILDDLKARGFQLSIDDFGTGFSSIGYLRQFPFDKMKIDQSFVRDIGKSSNANALIQSIIILGDAVELEVVAEGIETKEQIDLLRLAQCEYLQGYIFSKPVTIEEHDRLVERWPVSTSGEVRHGWLSKEAAPAPE